MVPLAVVVHQTTNRLTEECKAVVRLLLSNLLCHQSSIEYFHRQKVVTATKRQNCCRVQTILRKYVTGRLGSAS